MHVMSPVACCCSTAPCVCFGRTQGWAKNVHSCSAVYPVACRGPSRAVQLPIPVPPAACDSGKAQAAPPAGLLALQQSHLPTVVLQGDFRAAAGEGWSAHMERVVICYTACKAAPNGTSGMALLLRLHGAPLRTTLHECSSVLSNWCCMLVAQRAKFTAA